MKILQLRFKNINSLSGDNEIDFTHPSFSSEGLFAITGNTGAGKSSILDAIVLALYGKTPRVEISASENAVMTRGEKDCYSEIVFEVSGKQWKASWQQEKNRNGNLKPVHRRIADADNRIVADQVRACDAKIVEIVGLTFEQFTKVILLAQGSFAAFLQAKPNEKGELLEQMTGTEIYGEISRRVFERNKTENRILEKIALELEAFRPLSEEETRSLDEAFKEAEQHKNQAEAVLLTTEQARVWKTGMLRLESEISEIRQKLPELEIQVTETDKVYRESQARLEHSKVSQKNMVPILKRVRELDTQLAEKNKTKRPIVEKSQQLADRLSSIGKEIEKQEKLRRVYEKELHAKQLWVQSHGAYEALVSDFALIETQGKQLSVYDEELKGLYFEISALEEALETLTLKSEKQALSLSEKEEDWAKGTSQLHQLKAKMEALAEGKSVNVLLEEKQRITDEGLRLKERIALEEQWGAALNAKQDLICKEEKLLTSKSDLEKNIKVQKETAVRLEDKIKLLEENLLLIRTVQSLEPHRHRLKEGEACPLCGALEHPFAQGIEPRTDEKESELKVLKQEWQKVDVQLRADNERLAKLNSDLEHARQNLTKEEQHCADLVEKREAFQEEIHWETEKPKEGQPLVEALEQLILKKRQRLKVLNETIEGVYQMEREVTLLRDEKLPALLKAKEDVSETLKTSQAEGKLLIQRMEDRKTALSKLQKKRESQKETFARSLSFYQAENLSQLRAHLDAWKSHQSQILEHERLISDLLQSVAVARKEEESQSSFLKAQTEELARLNGEIEQLAGERKELFGDFSADEKERALHAEIHRFETEKSEAEKCRNAAGSLLQQSKAVLQTKIEEYDTLRQQALTEKTLQELQDEWDAHKAVAEQWAQTMGALRQKLQADEENRRRNAKKLKEKEKQQNLCRRWGALAELIGSSDGKKYRNFAQSLTFEHLVGLANRQLVKISDRYILKRNSLASNPFDLLVMDRFQNNEQRTVQNLSGGEKFIVSLALALGLAGMASKNMRVDTMFIDEGFGTLDSDYLDVALSALSNLHSEGKTIGVISHLSELKERISTHIEVVASGSGRSTIKLVKN
ncbi:AAA family ATPase [Bergeyella sp. RCAD1439]|uniref:AAA family ATPase n=1 Tax=Bergeyella anatis TaxID=3113737 RepID=UPI002E17FD1D|nr:AAA family ATPase [Bergeyella sp. RCAD1439]